MNAALLSSKNMCWCTPQDFFDKLNEEFSFTLDAAATDKTAKCPLYFTPETDGLKSSWKVAGGVRYFAIPRMAAKSADGFKRHTKRRRRSAGMSDRDKLIELIKESVGGCATYWASLIADHLIANGVVVSTDNNDGCKGCKGCLYEN